MYGNADGRLHEAHRDQEWILNNLKNHREIMNVQYVNREIMIRSCRSSFEYADPWEIMHDHHMKREDLREIMHEHHMKQVVLGEIIVD